MLECIIIAVGIIAGIAVLWALGSLGIANILFKKIIRKNDFAAKAAGYFAACVGHGLHIVKNGGK